MVTATGESAPRSTGPPLTVTTNLEQMSDGLTKIIVGVSLVNSQALLNKLDHVASLMAKSMPSDDSLTPMAAAGAAQAAATTAGATAAVAASAAALGVGSARMLALFSSTQALACAVIVHFLATGCWKVRC